LVSIAGRPAPTPAPAADLAPQSHAAAPAVTTFGDTSNAAPALVEFRGQTWLVWSSSFQDGTLNVATVKAVRG
jgi:hypothetical protein